MIVDIWTAAFTGTVDPVNQLLLLYLDIWTASLVGTVTTDL